MTFRVRSVAVLLFFSGACALVYQVAWFRELRLIFGASTASSAAVLAIFMGGLGLGGARLGKRADASPNPLAMYANLEIAVACTAGATPLLVWLANTVYIGAGGSTSLGTVGASVLRVLLSVVVLGPATFLMGGTLPAAARAVERDDDGPRRSVATLYGVNTFGAVVGALLANFLLLEVLGTRITLWVAALVNVLVGMVARTLARGAGVPTRARTPDAGATVAESPEAEPAASSSTSSSSVDIPRWFPPAASALAGVAFMLMELTWYRMLAPLLGGSSYTFGLILAVALVGIAIGGAAYARTKVPATLRAFAITCSLEALFIAIPYAAGDGVAITTALLRGICHQGFGASTAVWTLIAAFVVLPAAIVSGIQFPLVIGLYGRGSKGVGRDVGAAYLANTIGSIVGSIAGGFGLMPLLGAIGSWKLVVLSLTIGASVAMVLDARAKKSRPARAVFGLAFVWAPALLLLATGPTAIWRHSGIGAGRADAKIQGESAQAVTVFTRDTARSVRWDEDGVESSVAIVQNQGFSFIVNGKSDGHATKDAPTQVMGGMLAALLHGDPKSALIVGLGTGSTAGWLGAIPAMERVDVVELEPAILRVARDCAPVNENVLDNPKVHVHLADAREYLRTTKDRQYDIIFSEPSNPYRAGISSLYTVEYYRATAERVAKGGVFVQWIQAYEVDGWAIATALATLRQVFPKVDVWQTMSGDLVLIARGEHTPIDVNRMRKTLVGEPYARAARDVWRTNSVEGVLSHFIARSVLSDALVERGIGAVNTDDQNFLEFAFARSVGHQRKVDDDLAALARRLNMNIPDTVGAVDWGRVDEERWLFQEYLASASGVPANQRNGLGGVVSTFEVGRHAAALKMWKRLNRAPDSLGEAALVAECVARSGEDADVALLEGAPMPERDYLRAVWAARHNDGAGASAALVRLFTASRTNPWARASLLIGALNLAREIGERDARYSRMLYDALIVPFAVENLRDHRFIVAARLAGKLPEPALCVKAFAELEPPPALGRDWFEQRAACYRKANDPRVVRADKDVLDLLEREAPLGASIPTPPQAAKKGVTDPGAGLPANDAGYTVTDGGDDDGHDEGDDAGVDAAPR